VDLDAGIMALHQASASSEQARMLSTRPRRKRRIDALSYVDTRRPWTLRKTAKSSALLADSIYASSSRVTGNVRCNTFASVRIYPSGKSEILTVGASSRTTLLGGGVLAPFAACSPQSFIGGFEALPTSHNISTFDYSLIIVGLIDIIYLLHSLFVFCYC